MARRRDERIDSAVLDAVTALVREVGYPNLTMDAIATRAGTTKPAIRRRWKSQKHLVVAAMAAGRPEPAETIDTGCTHCDITGYLEAFRREMTDPAVGHVLPGLVADLAGDPELRAAFLDSVWEPRRAACVRAMQAAKARGDFRPGLDLDLMVDLFISPIVVRALFGHRAAGPDFPDEIARAVLLGVGTGSGSPCRFE